MINAPIEVVRQTLQETSGWYLDHVPSAELEYFRSVDGPITDDNWRHMPVLFDALISRGRLA